MAILNLSKVVVDDAEGVVIHLDHAFVIDSARWSDANEAGVEDVKLCFTDMAEVGSRARDALTYALCSSKKPSYWTRYSTHNT